MNKHKKPKLKYDVLNLEVDDDFKEIVEKFSEKELTPIEMDFKVRIERVLYVLNRTLAITKIMVYMPTYLKDDADLLKKFFKPEDVYFILKVTNKYGYDFDVSKYYHEWSNYVDILENINVTKMIKFGKPGSALSNISNPQCNQMINMFFNNNCVWQLVTGSGGKKVDKSMTDFYKTLLELKAIVKEMIMETGEEEVAKNKELRQAYKHNVLVIKSNKELEERLQKQRNDFGEQLNKKRATIGKYNKKMETIKEEFHEQTETVLTESEKVMMNRTVISEEREVALAIEAKRVTKEFEELMENHLEEEKLSRSKRFKAQTQLQNWLSKYDQDIGERQAEYETVKESYDKEMEEMEALQNIFDEQEVEYEILMTEKQLEEDMIRNEKIYAYLCNRSARIIQRCWREYIIRKRARRKARRGKGKAGKKLV